jgi:RNA polymerase sigma factor (sigma-70 family)
MNSTPEEASDTRDLREYAATGSSDAFGRLTERYSRMVFSACLRRLGSREDAEDATQSVFLALARKAGSLRPGNLRSWLHGVAVRTAAFVARTRARRARREKEAAEMTPPAAEANWDDVRPHLDMELNRLPSRLREAVTGHYLAGLTRAELARELGVPVGTVQSRIHAGLQKLRTKLARRGAVLSAGALAPMLAANCLEPLPAGLTASVKAVCLGQAAAAPAVLAAAEGTLKAMTFAKVKAITVAVTAAVVIGGAGSSAVATFLGNARAVSNAGAIRRLREMPANSWLELDPPREPLSRASSGCCFGGGRLWYFGGGHYSWKGNDVELYDPRINEWHRATEPEWPREGTAAWKSLTSGSDGTKELSPSGRPYTEHTFQQVCWDPKAGKFVAVLRWSGTWEFDPGKAVWTRLVATAPSGGKLPYAHISSSLAVYDPALEAPVLILTAKKSPGVFFLERSPRGARWNRLGDTPADLLDARLYATYVPKWTGHLVSCRRRDGSRWFDLSFVTLRAVKIKEGEGPPPCSALAYDSLSRTVIAMEPREVADKTYVVRPWALDVETLRWTELSPSGPVPAGAATGSWAPLWYDREHNVFLFLNSVGHGPRLRGGPTQTWAYRYRKIR